jgi:hypothetical protein
MSEDEHSSKNAPAADGTTTPARPDAAVSSTVGAAAVPAANTAATKASTPLKPASSAASQAAGTVTSKPPTPSTPPFKPAASMPLSMTNSPLSDGISNSKDETKGGISEDDFANVIAALKPLPRRSRSLAERLLRGLRGKSRAPAPDVDRHVAFDGYQDKQHDDKIERDRRYGTVYTITEHENAYLVRLELPRKMPSSSLKEAWHLSEAKPEYDSIIELSHNVLSIRGRLRGEALRRLAYVSPSFPSGFLTRIEFAKPVDQIVHCLRESGIEVIAYKTARVIADGEIRDNQGQTAVTE